ncbi:MAG: Holliday junction resolvase Hjc [Candidatus Diapherotrites archaeon]|nr:Holliday junction resolvase Hjc [Candidatus Diapherotrites archaeon]
MARYAKGANAERELLKIFHNMGFAVMRAAGSGKTALPSPDLVVIKKNVIFAIEAKAWAGDYLSISVDQMSELIDWCKNASAHLIIAWKISHKGWRLIDLNSFRVTDKFYMISEKEAIDKGALPEDIFKLIEDDSNG